MINDFIGEVRRALTELTEEHIHPAHRASHLVVLDEAINIAKMRLVAKRLPKISEATRRIAFAVQCTSEQMAVAATLAEALGLAIVDVQAVEKDTGLPVTNPRDKDIIIGVTLKEVIPDEKASMETGAANNEKGHTCQCQTEGGCKHCK